ncbi:MAG: hypothetical protein H3Z52_05960 [archaeon]|nr:hypothetical protein [archaeon]MCP8316077.1 hypothetical protein [archaeon]MCP8320468.1 hypothetical protein [archaeon]
MGIKKRFLGFYYIVLERIKQLIGKKRLIRLYSIFSLRRLIEIAYMLALLFLFAGIINALLEGQYYSDYTIVPSFRIQSLVETFLNLFAIIIGTSGIYLMYLGGRRTGAKKAPSLYVISGLTVLIISVLIWLFIIGVKGG